MWTVVRKITCIVVYLYRRFVDDGLTTRAASLAYTTLLSLVPLMIIGFSVLSLFPRFRGLGEEIQKFIIANFVAQSADVITKYLDAFLLNVTRLSIMNLIFLAIVAVLMMYNINRAFNAVWRAEHRFRFTLSFLVYFIVLLVSPIVLGGLVVLGTFLAHVSFIGDVVKAPYVRKPLFFILPYVLTFITFTIFNWVLPSCKVRLLHAAIGGLLSMLLFQLAKYGFTVYLTHFPTYRLLYGALATIPIFLIWLYVSWTIILLGTLVTNVLAYGVPKEEMRRWLAR